MLSIIADAMMAATRQDNTGWPKRDAHYAARFTSPERKRAAERARHHNPYSFFQ